MVVTYDNAVSEIHTQIITLLRTDSNVTSFTSKILDGKATDVTKRFGLYVLVHSPSIEETKYVAGGKHQLHSVVEVEVRGKKESVVRQLIDAVRKCLNDNLSSLYSSALFNKRVNVSRVFNVPIESGEVMDSWHVGLIDVEFDFYES